MSGRPNCPSPIRPSVASGATKSSAPIGACGMGVNAWRVVSSASAPPGSPASASGRSPPTARRETDRSASRPPASGSARTVTSGRSAPNRSSASLPAVRGRAGRSQSGRQADGWSLGNRGRLGRRRRRGRRRRADGCGDRGRRRNDDGTLANDRGLDRHAPGDQALANDCALHRHLPDDDALLNDRALDRHIPDDHTLHYKGLAAGGGQCRHAKRNEPGQQPAA